MSTVEIKSIVHRALSKHSANAFRPTDAHRRAKSAYWSHFFQEGEIPPDTIDAANAARYSGYNEVIKWWAEVEGFPEWFSNGEEFRQQVEYLSHLSLDVLQQTLQDTGERTADRLNAAKMALEIAAKFPSRTPKDKMVDDTINAMDRRELEEFIQGKLRILPNKEGQ